MVSFGEKGALCSSLVMVSYLYLNILSYVSSVLLVSAENVSPNDDDDDDDYADGDDDDDDDDDGGDDDGDDDDDDYDDDDDDDVDGLYLIFTV